MFMLHISVQLLHNRALSLYRPWAPVQALQVFSCSLCVLKTRYKREGIQIMQITKLIYIIDNMQTQLRTQSPLHNTVHNTANSGYDTAHHGLFKSDLILSIVWINRLTVKTSTVKRIQIDSLFNRAIKWQHASSYSWGVLSVRDAQFA